MAFVALANVKDTHTAYMTIILYMRHNYVKYISYRNTMQECITTRRGHAV